MPEIVEREFSYKIMGMLFSVHNQLGNRYQEKYYQRAIEEGLKLQKIRYKKEILVDLMFNKVRIGKYFLDFLIEEKIILEVKTVENLKPKDFKQVLAYLTSKNIQLGILANFRSDRLTYKRILNSKYIRKN